DETAHAIVLDDAPRIDSMTVQRSDEAKAITERCREVARRAQDADHRNPHGAARYFHAGIEGVALHHGIEAPVLGLNDLLDQSRSFQGVMKTGQCLAFAQMARHLTAAEVFRIMDLYGRPGRS